jgi:hypothetical protein
MVNWLKPTVDTKYHIDFDWWEEQGRNFRVQLLSQLCTECQSHYKDHREADMVDWIDAETAEVTQVDGLWHSLRMCCSLKPDYIDDRTPLTTAVFKIFLANGNQPLAASDLAAQLHKPAGTILRTLGGFQVYNGIRPLAGQE